MSKTSDSAARFEPDRWSTFVFLPPEVDADRGRANLPYELRDEAGAVLRFEERVSFDLPAAPLTARARSRFGRAVRLLHLMAGVSYYKTAIPQRVVTEGLALSASEACAYRLLYEEGLGEFGVVNGVAMRGRVVFRADPVEEAPHDEDGASVVGRPLVPIGGGKDSFVTARVLADAGREPIAFVVGRNARVCAAAEATGIPVLYATRVLDPLLLEINARGALNGHIPVTAIVSLMAVAAASLHGLGDVVMSNERSASAAEVSGVGGVAVNHQFSKGLDAERAIAALAEISLGPRPRYWSLLRPLSELSICRLFATMREYHGVFTSCNANFRQAGVGTGAERWCNACPKCLFVFLALAPWLKPDGLRSMFGADLLSIDANIEGFAALIGHEGREKPFECVGEMEESLAALLMLSRDPAWSGHAVVRWFRKEVEPRVTNAQDVIDRALAWSDDHRIPSDSAAVLDALR